MTAMSWPWEQAGRTRQSLPNVTPGSCLDYALRYAALGWPVFPVHGITRTAGISRCDCGDAECKSPGKHPLTNHGLKDATTDPEQIRRWWTQWPIANIGIPMGAVSGVFAIDVDIKPDKRGDESLDALQDQHGRLPDTVEAITGSGGRHLLFKYPGKRIPNGTNRLGPGLDVRGDGGYIVVEPSTHISGQNYAWEGSSDPLEGVKPAEAPAWLLELLEPVNGTPITQATKPPLSAAQVVEIRSALGYIDADDYELWINEGISLKSTGAGSQAFGLWCEWSQLSEKYDPAVQRKKWATFTDKGMDGRTLRSLFADAQARGWVNVASIEAQTFNRKEQDLKALMAAAEKRQHIEVIDDPAPSEIEPIPVPHLNELATWIDAHAMLSLPAVSRQAALAVAAATTARRFISSAGDPCQVFLGIVTDSVGEARFACHAIENIFAVTAQRRMLRSNRFSSPQSIYRMLLQNPSLLYLCTDYGPQVAFARRQPSGLLELAMHQLSTVWGGHDLQIDPQDDLGAVVAKALRLGDDITVIYKPAITMLALVSDAHLNALFRSSEFGRGAIEQILFATPPARADIPLKEPGNPPSPDWLIEHVDQVMSSVSAGNLETVAQASATMPPRLRTVEFDLSTQEEAEALRDLVRTERPLWSLALGAHVTLRRLATALAAWADPGAPIVTRPILDWCARYVLEHLHQTIEHYRILSTDEGQTSIYDKTLEAIAKAGSAGITQRDLAKKCWAFRKAGTEARAKLIEAMLADDQVCEVQNGKASVLVLRKYVKFKDDKS